MKASKYYESIYALVLLFSYKVLNMPDEKK